MNNKVSWHDLTEAEKEIVGNVPGAGVFTDAIDWMLNDCIGLTFNNFTFGPHDWAYVRGGGVWDKVKSDIQMFLYILIDATEQKNILKGLAAVLMAPVAFLTVFTFGFFFFDFVPYRTKREALLLALENK